MAIDNQIQQFADSIQHDVLSVNHNRGVITITLQETPRNTIQAKRKQYWRTRNAQRQATPNKPIGTKNRYTYSKRNNRKPKTFSEKRIEGLLIYTLQDTMISNSISVEQWAELLNTYTRNIYNWRKSTFQSREMGISKGSIQLLIEQAEYLHDPKLIPNHLSDQGKVEAAAFFKRVLEIHHIGDL